MEKSSNKKAKSVTVYNKISNSFRELHIDGAYGGVTPKGLFNINFYAERLAIPKSTEFEIVNNKLSKIGDSADSKKGIIREFEAGVYMTIETAKELHKWLGDNIEKNEARKQKIKQ